MMILLKNIWKMISSKEDNQRKNSIASQPVKAADKQKTETATKIPPELKDNSNRQILTDKYFSGSISDTDLRYTVFIRLNAVSSKKKPILFENVRFDHGIFESCYIRDCIFDSCSFVGCRFSNSNFHGSRFNGCKFDYASFEKTQLDVDLLDREAPYQENLKMRFARTLRMNFQQLGDAEAVNKAISLELIATEQHLYKSWSSNETYYVTKYPGLVKIGRFFLWARFRALDLLWGNGESLPKLFRTLMIAIFLVGIFDAYFYHNPFDLKDYYASLLQAPAIFFGVSKELPYHSLYSAAITVIRLTLFALFTAILVKRFSRR